MNCIDRNGEITGYSIRYGKVETAEGDRTVLSEDDTRYTTISGLTPSTNYTIEVAAVNGFGTGPYSESITQETDGKHVT